MKTNQETKERPNSKVAWTKTVLLFVIAIFILGSSIWLVSDWYVNGDPFCISGCKVNQITSVYPSSLSLATQGAVFGNADMRVGVFFTFNTTIIAGENVEVNARVVISPTADARIRSANDAIAIVIPSASASKTFNDTSLGIPNQFVLGLIYIGNKSGSLVYGDLSGPGIPIYFPDQGNYQIYVVIQSYHYSSGLISTNTPVSVEPRSMEQTLLFAREQRTFTFALLIFAMMEGASFTPRLYGGSVLEPSTFKALYHQEKETKKSEIDSKKR